MYSFRGSLSEWFWFITGIKDHWWVACQGWRYFSAATCWLTNLSPLDFLPLSVLPTLENLELCCPLGSQFQLKPHFPKQTIFLMCAQVARTAYKKFVLPKLVRQVLKLCVIMFPLKNEVWILSNQANKLLNCIVNCWGLHMCVFTILSTHWLCFNRQGWWFWNCPF